MNTEEKNKRETKGRKGKARAANVVFGLSFEKASGAILPSSLVPPPLRKPRAHLIPQGILH